MRMNNMLVNKLYNLKVVEILFFRSQHTIVVADGSIMM